MENRDEELWKLAEARVGFKRHLTTYLSVNVLVWLLWYFTGSIGSGYGNLFLPWPIWMTFGWGIGLVLHFIGVYVNNSYNSGGARIRKVKRKKLVKYLLNLITIAYFKFCTFMSYCDSIFKPTHFKF